MSRTADQTRFVLLAVSLAALLLAAGSLYAADAPKLDRVKISPDKGDTNTLFTFMIVYTGATTPTSCNLYLDSKVVVMKSAGAAPISGVMYTYQTKLTAGTHKYRFRFVAGTQTLLSPGPADTNWYTSFSVVAAPSYTISGTVRCDGQPLSGVEITVYKQGTTVRARTDSQGKFTARNLAPGNWRVTPALTGFTMTPEYVYVSVPPNKVNCDFTAKRVPRTGSRSG